VADYSEVLVEKQGFCGIRAYFEAVHLTVIYKKSAFINISGFFFGLHLAWGGEKIIFV